MVRWKDEKWDKFAKREKVRKSRKDQATKNLISEKFECEESTWEKLISEGCFIARVVEVHKKYAFVSKEKIKGEINTRDVWIATVARKFLQAYRKERNFFCVGDRVLCKPGGENGEELSADLPTCTIIQRAPRFSQISRLDPMTPERSHVLASNINQLIIVASYVYPKIKWGLIDRYITLAEEQEISIVIVLNKNDLLKDQKEKFREECHWYVELYKSLGYELFSLNALDCKGQDLEYLKKLFSNKISLVSGHSGVGKSSIVNLLKPEINQEVETEEILTKGRHTTTYASLIKLGTGGYVVDSPGIRSFMIEERKAIDLSWCFVEMRPYLDKCKYRRCRHIDEPNCAIKDAVKEGLISGVRYNSYIALLTGASGREGRLRDITID